MDVAILAELPSQQSSIYEMGLSHHHGGATSIIM